MFKHQGNTRTLTHNLRLAVVLSFVAGLVNITGLLSLDILTTNVTGHFAFFVQKVSQLNIRGGLVFLTYVSSFLFGSFISNLIMEFFRHNRKLNVYLVPILLEALLLIFIVIIGLNMEEHSFVISNLLLLSMGLQNSFVTKISNAVVRTTHLTGLFTDLGIELAQLLFEKDKVKRREIQSTISLRISIIAFFFIGGLVATILYINLGLGMVSLLLASIILILSLIYDDQKFISKRTIIRY
ncbi:YoaK family protein [Saccharicrinis aurantiacus]|uniref:YoaK family protein n=1 Tax=Saccharicrinis aurantiacus TaxID=1849719 RepID=UPI002492BE93|nr:YoaK family protein [Saccharicrinis aurantiacus]